MKFSSRGIGKNRFAYSEALVTLSFAKLDEENRWYAAISIAEKREIERERKKKKKKKKLHTLIGWK